MTTEYKSVILILLFSHGFRGTMDHSVIYYFWAASLVVKVVMLVLLVASIASWTFIFQRSVYLRQQARLMNQFEDRFWSGGQLTKLYQELQHQNTHGLATVFQSGFKEFLQLESQPGITADAVIEGVRRAMRVAASRVQDSLETHLPFLATVGSVSPYIGLFGTVWGIMASFQSLSTAGQATIAAVAPGISEALVATAMGLFAAIPAVIAYNRFASRVDRLLNRVDSFQEELATLLYRHAQQTENRAHSCVNSDA